MLYHVSQHGTNIGKFSEADILKNLADGRFAYTDHFWAVGMPGWLPLSHFRPTARPVVSSPAAAVRPATSKMPHVPFGSANSQASYASPGHTAREQGKTLGCVGGGLLALGVFGPAAELGKLGISIIANGNAKGMIVLAMGCCGILLALLRQYAFIWLPAAIAGIILGEMCLKLADAPTSNLFGESFRISPGWGLFVMVAGNALLFCSAWTGSMNNRP